MKAATFTKMLAAAALIAVPIMAHAQSVARQGATVRKAEKQAETGELAAALAAAAAAAGAGIALTGKGTPASA